MTWLAFKDNKYEPCTLKTADSLTHSPCHSMVPVSPKSYKWLMTQALYLTQNWHRPHPVACHSPVQAFSHTIIMGLLPEAKYLVSVTKNIDTEKHSLIVWLGCGSNVEHAVFETQGMIWNGEWLNVHCYHVHKATGTEGQSVGQFLEVSSMFLAWVLIGGCLPKLMSSAFP